jgi:hypothetical protein
MLPRDHTLPQAANPHLNGNGYFRWISYNYMNFSYNINSGDHKLTVAFNSKHVRSPLKAPGKSRLGIDH